MMGGSMNSDLVALIVSRLDSIDKTLAEDRKTSTESRGKVYGRLEGMSKQMTDVEGRVVTLEAHITSMSPTVEEFVTYKERVRGAGVLGRLLWMVGGVLLTSAVAISGWWHNIVAAWNAFFTAR
jgi:hypothetical protein